VNNLHPQCPKCGSTRIGVAYSESAGCSNCIHCPDCHAEWKCSGLLELARFFATEPAPAPPAEVDYPETSTEGIAALAKNMNQKLGEFPLCPSCGETVTVDWEAHECPPEPPPKCPTCDQPLKAITYPSDSPLNRDQWESQRAGDWFCTCHNNYRGNKPYAYYWSYQFPRKPTAAEQSPEYEEARKAVKHLKTLKADHNKILWLMNWRLLEATRLPAPVIIPAITQPERAPGGHVEGRAEGGKEGKC
jgi:hypothetical protein